MLKTHEDIKQYVIQTIRSGNKKRITAVMRRYQKYLKEEKESAYETAKKVLPHQAPDYLALRHLAPGDRATVLDQLGVRQEQSASLSGWGHHGTNDVILSLNLGLETGAIQDGSIVALVSGGIGFTYASALIQWGTA